VGGEGGEGGRGGVGVTAVEENVGKDRHRRVTTDEKLPQLIARRG
jgi:hypothetical protein